MAKQTEAAPETIHNGVDTSSEWDAAAPPALANDEVSQSELLVYVAKHQEMAEKVGNIRKKRSLVRRHMKNRGILLHEFDQAIKEMDAQDPEATLDQQAALAKYRRFLGVPTNETPDLFVSQQQDEGVRAGLAEGQGYIAGHTGKNRDDSPYELNSVEGIEYIKGWHRGQAALAAGIKELPRDLGD